MGKDCSVEQGQGWILECIEFDLRTAQSDCSDVTFLFGFINMRDQLQLSVRLEGKDGNMECP